MPDTRGVVTTAKQVVGDVTGKNVPFMAAGIAYNAFVSLAPLLLLLLFVASTVGEQLEQRIVDLAAGSLPGPIADTVTVVFEDGTGFAGASVVGALVLLWGTLKIFRGLDTAFSEIYETGEANSFVDKLIDGVVVLGALVVAMVATVAATLVVSVFADVIPYPNLVSAAVVVGGLVAAFVPMYYRFPDTDLEWAHVFPGVLFAAVGWAIFQKLFEVYLSVSGSGAGSVFGGIVVVVTWLYFSGLILLLGAVINAVVGGYSSGKAGGVGQGAAGYETTRETDLPREMFGNYLLGLRADVTDRAGTTHPTVGEDGVDHYPPPEGDVHVVEQTNRDGDSQQWAVAISWEAPIDDATPSETSAVDRRQRSDPDRSSTADD